MRPAPGPVAPGAAASVWARPAAGVVLDPGGWLGAWERTNREATIDHCIAQLAERGALDNLRRLTGEHDGPRVGFMFSDSDVYKVLEAAGWETQRALEAGEGPGETLAEFVPDAVDLLSRAQQDDGYLNSFAGADGRARWSNLRWDHELYCLGHLLQAAVAWHRVPAGDLAAPLARARERLLGVARRFADHVLARWRAGEPVLCGHPEIETALVEFHRATGVRAYLDLAVAMIDARGHGTLGPDAFGPAYFQDHMPVRDARDAEGHAVRQLYLLAGVVDAAAETGDAGLLSAAERLWRSAHAAKMHVTGGMGSRHRDEAYGDDYELPPDRGYAETCAAVADFMLSHRLLLATGDAGYGRAMDRTLYNALAAAVDGTGTRFFYSCPLQMRTDRAGAHEQAPAERAPWYECACCPPNLARLLASMRHAVAASTDDGLAVLLPVSARIPSNGAEIVVESALPYGGAVQLSSRDRESGAPEACGERVRIRLPEGADLETVAGAEAHVDAGWLVVEPGWSSVRIDLRMGAMVRRAHHRADALRGHRVVTRGPVVYALEGVDVPADVRLEDVRLAQGSAAPRVDGEILGAPAVVVSLASDEAGARGPEQLYPVAGADGLDAPSGAEAAGFTARLVPFGLWGRRGTGAMRVWIPAGD
ncbi:glycoside hydrolase family 127 protein [Zhihengliuella halotolerans]|uniref:Glycoside hydrolase family 127 protein n=1 Tax=Zhihengliuella halotolerans TaxID=370736 RepID=A0A4Q8AAQ3_9MICC|nr:beta-L-arabinofuranosidase domain-containing protein [Zhihengliuella halotolerans]RZU60625.1 hypothetical protein EV380_0169 [Zhihengliuella halotolerans]